jgi:spermidine synthase
VGGGTLAHLLVRRNPAVRLLGVDNDPEVIAFARRHFGLRLPNLEILIADAFAFVEGCRERFDYVAVDLFTGHTFQRGVLARPFLRALPGLLAPGGEIAINMFRDRRAEVRVGRIRRVLPVQQVERLPRNVVVHSRPDETGPHRQDAKGAKA